jgi:hypothetical protein
MKFEFNALDNILTVKLPPQLTSDDLAKAADYLVALDEKLAVTPHRLTDTAAVEKVLVRYPEIEKFASQRRRAILKNAIKSAIVAPQPLHLGFARMFQTLNDNPQITIRIFSDTASAWQWLKPADTKP